MLTVLIASVLVFSVVVNSTAVDVRGRERFVDAIIMFDSNVKVDIHGMEIIHRYDALNGVAARIPVSMYRILENAWFVSSIQIDKEWRICQDTLDWGVDDVDAEVVWGGSENAVDVIPGNVDGTGVKVAILDTGIDYTHPDLDDNYRGGYDFVDNDADPLDGNGHGTHCAGIVAAEDNGIGVIGTAPHASLYAVRVLDDQGSGYTSDIIAGIDWAINNGMDVISMSLGGGSYDASFDDAVTRAYNAGIVVVAASGNDGTGTISYPAAYTNAIAVGAIDSNHNLASFSNYGPEQEVVAPGVDIYSTMPTYSVTLTSWWYGYSNDYDTMSGTSMATPMVAGVVALILSANPNLTPPEVRDILHTTSTDLGATGWDQYYGYGEVNSVAAVDAAGGGTPPDTTPPAQVTGLTATTVSSSQIDLSWNANSESDLDHYNIYRDGTLIGTTTATTYSDSGLSPETTYTYEVSAVDTAGNEGTKSDPASATTDPAPPDTTPPAKVTGLTATPASSTSIDLSWDANTESDLSYYNIYRDGVKIATTTSTTYTDTGLSPSTTYTYEVSAVDTAGNEGTKSDPASATTYGDNTMHVASIDMWYEPVRWWFWIIGYDVYTKVTVHDQNGNALEGVDVYLEMTLPGGSTATGNALTGADGTVTFVYQQGGKGTYTSTVTNLVKSGYTYDSGSNVETSETLTVP